MSIIVQLDAGKKELKSFSGLNSDPQILKLTTTNRGGKFCFCTTWVLSLFELHFFHYGKNVLNVFITDG